MKIVRKTGTLLVAVIIGGCGSNAKDQIVGSDAKGRIVGNAKELIVGKWDEAKARPEQKLFSRWEYTRDGKAKWWQLENTKGEPGTPVNEGTYRFLDDRTFAITMKNGDVISTDKFTIASISKDKLVLVTEEKKNLVYARAK